MEARPVISPALGLAVGLGSAVPFAVGSIVLVDPMVFGISNVGAMLAAACLVSGSVTGASFGRLVAARPTIWRVLGAVALAVLIGTLVAVVVAEQWQGNHGYFFTIMFLALAFYGLAAFLALALPAFLLGAWIARRLGRRTSTD